MKLSLEERLRRMVETLRTFRPGYAVTAGQLPGLAAQRWVEGGFDSARARAWLGAGCFSPDAARDLRQAGITPGMVGTVFVEEKKPFLGLKRLKPLGAAVAAGELGVPEARTLLMDKGLLVNVASAMAILRDTPDLTRSWNRDRIFHVAHRWTQIGFAPEEMRGYLAARCFDPEKAMDLRDGGISPAQAARRQSVLAPAPGGPGRSAYLDPHDTVGWRVTSGQSTVPAARALIERLETVETILAGGSTPVGIEREPIEIAAVQWTAQGFLPEDVGRWTRSRCFEPEAAASLRGAGVRPEQAAVRTSEGAVRAPGGAYTQTVGFKVSMGDLSVAQAKEVIHGGPDVTEVIEGLRPVVQFAPEGAARAAMRWERMGFLLGSDVRAWAQDACCFFPECARKMQKMGVSAAEAATVGAEGGYRHTLGFKFSRGDISEEQVMRAVDRVRERRARAEAGQVKDTPAVSVLVAEIAQTVSEEFGAGRDLFVTNSRYAEVVRNHPEVFLLDPGHRADGVRVLSVVHPELPQGLAVDNPLVPGQVLADARAARAAVEAVPVVGRTVGAALPTVERFESLRADVLRRLREGRRDVVVTGPDAETLAQAEANFRLDETYTGEGVRVAAAVDPEAGRIVYNQYGNFMQDVSTRQRAASDLAASAAVGPEDDVREEAALEESQTVNDYYVHGLSDPEKPQQGNDLLL